VICLLSSARKFLRKRSRYERAHTTAYIGHIRQAAEDARSFTEGLSKEEFLADKRTQSAVVMSLVIIGEAATKIMDQHPEFATQRSDVPWRSMRGMRNRIAHGYFEINLDLVWETVGTALPKLLELLPPAGDDVSDEDRRDPAMEP
jgi:uncharacterized protein with HEPN domain